MTSYVPLLLVVLDQVVVLKVLQNLLCLHAGKPAFGSHLLELSQSEERALFPLNPLLTRFCMSSCNLRHFSSALSPFLTILVSVTHINIYIRLETPTPVGWVGVVRCVWPLEP